jgi:hypothetical protein
VLVQGFVARLGRDFHALHQENGGCDLRATAAGNAIYFAPYPGVPAVRSLANAEYRHAPDWYRGFFYAEEAARGLDAREDLASPRHAHLRARRERGALGAQRRSAGRLSTRTRNRGKPRGSLAQDGTRAAQ